MALELEKIMKIVNWMILGLVAQCFALNVSAQNKLEFSGECNYPESPAFDAAVWTYAAGVDGSTATEAQMLTFQKEMKDYLALGNAFLECLDNEESDMDTSASAEDQEEFKAKITQTYNAVVDEMNAVADQFNTALRAYKSQNK